MTLSSNKCPLNEDNEEKKVEGLVFVEATDMISVTGSCLIRKRFEF